LMLKTIHTLSLINNYFYKKSCIYRTFPKKAINKDKFF
jgi:hypothetical protein